MSDEAKPHQLAYYLLLVRQLLGVPRDRRAVVAHLKADPEMRARYQETRDYLTILLREVESETASRR
jgi:hypothetical protein